MKLNTLDLLTPEKRQSILKARVVKKKEKNQLNIKRALKNLYPCQPSTSVFNLSDNLLAYELINYEGIVSSSAKYKSLTGIYFLILKGCIVYIGQSLNIHARIGQHCGRYDFDSWSFFECDKSELDLVESLYIQAYRPAFNGLTAKGNPISPLSLDRLKQMAGKQ